MKWQKEDCSVTVKVNSMSMLLLLYELCTKFAGSVK